MLMGTHGPFKTSPEGKPGVPNVMKGFEHNADFTEWTLYLRKGLKWSDGTELTAENWLLFWKHFRANPDLNPSIRTAKVTIEDKAVTFYNEFNFKRTVRKEVIDDYTLKYTADISYPTLINHLSHPHSRQEYYLMPMHFLMQFHPDSIGEAEATAKAKKAGFDHWYELFLFFHPIQGQQTTVQVLGNFPPTLSPYVCVSKTQTKLIWERNPFYWKVDTDGNQLPYMDRIICEYVPKKELINGKVITGEVDFEGFMTTTPDIPLFKKYEEQGDYHTDIWNFAANASVYHIYYNYKDPVVRELFRTKNFRIALSHGVNRERINNEVLFGKGRPVRMSILPNTMWFKPEYESKYSEYDPEKAMKLLDELGVTDKDGDGWRDNRDGKAISWVVEFRESEAPRVPISEIVKENWRALGLKVDVKVIESTLDAVRSRTNDVAMRVWHGDARTETLFTAYINSHMFPRTSAPSYYLYYTTGGKEGAEPPAELVRDVYDAFNKMERATSREEMIKWGQTMAASNMENVWVIGTVNDFPHPMIVRNDLLNFPTEKDGPLLYIWSTWWTNAYEPAQFYFRDRPLITFDESALPKLYPVDKDEDPVERAKREGWL